MIHCNLACDAAQQGNVSMARDRLATTISLEGEEMDCQSVVHLGPAR